MHPTSENTSCGRTTQIATQCIADRPTPFQQERPRSPAADRTCEHSRRSDSANIIVIVRMSHIPAQISALYHQSYVETGFKNLVFTALHVMQTRYSEENSVCLSVCPSVRPSVTRMICDKTVERSVQIFIPYERTFILVF